jgi:hypothetical protein
LIQTLHVYSAPGTTLNNNYSPQGGCFKTPHFDKEGTVCPATNRSFAKLKPRFSEERLKF